MKKKENETKDQYEKRIDKRVNIGCAIVVIVPIVLILYNLINKEITTEINNMTKTYKLAVCHNSISEYNYFLELYPILGSQYQEEIIQRRNVLLKKINVLNNQGVPKKIKIKVNGMRYIKFDNNDSIYMPLKEYTQQLIQNLVGYEICPNGKEDMTILINYTIHIHSSNYQRGYYASEQKPSDEYLKQEISTVYGMTISGNIIALINNYTISEISFSEGNYVFREYMPYAGKGSKTLDIYTLPYALNNYTISVVNLLLNITNKYSLIEIIKNCKNLNFCSSYFGAYNYESIVDSAVRLNSGVLNLTKNQIDSIIFFRESDCTYMVK